MKFKIDITDTVIERAYVEVEATDWDEARDTALSMIENGDIKFEFCCVEDRDLDIREMTDETVNTD